jgi:hypothetical protein
MMNDECGFWDLDFGIQEEGRRWTVMMGEKCLLPVLPPSPANTPKMVLAGTNRKP